MNNLEFEFWHPIEEPVHLEFMLVRDGFGVERADLMPSADEVLAAGNLLGVRPGEPFSLSAITTDRARRDTSYRVALRVTMRPIQQSGAPHMRERAAQ
jgi:hypothetical protein